MRRFQWLFSLFLMLMILCLPASGAEREKTPSDIQTLLNSAGDSTRFPDADVITVFEKTDIDFRENGDSVTREHGLVKILTEAGKKSYATLEYSYHKRFQDVIVELTRVIYPDGTSVIVPAGEVKDVTSSDTQEMNIYEESFRKKTVALPDLQAGCSIEYITVVKARALLKDNYADEFMFQGGNPILEKTVTITGPATKPLKYVVRNGTLAFTEKKEGSTITWRWEARQVPMIIPEPGMVSISDVGTKLTVSTFRTWKELSRFGDALNTGKIDMNPALREEVRRLTRGLKSDEEKILAIFRFISQKIRYMGSSMDMGAFCEPHKATYTYEKQYGICRDKSVLMASMLHEIGIESKDVLINVTVETEREVPSIYFQHAICAVILKDGRTIYMDPTMELSSSFGDTYVGGRYTLMLSREGDDLKLMPPVAAEKSLGRIDTRSVLDEKGNLKGSVQVKGNGYYDLVLRSINQNYPALQFERLLSRLGTRFHPGTSVSGVRSTNPNDLATPYYYRCDFATPDYTVPAGRFILFPLPMASGSFDLVVSSAFNDLTRLKERKYPIDIFSTAGCHTSGIVTIPEGFRVVSLPPSLSMKEGPVTAEIRTEVKGRDIIYNSDYRVEKERLSPREYQDLRKVALALKKFNRSMVILEKAR